MRYLISFVFGLLFGSFANVCILRLPAEESLWTPRSHCPKCDSPIKNRHNIPILSFLILKGQCHQCAAPISWQYPAIEALMGILFLFHAFFFAGSLPLMVIADILGFYLLTLSIIDFRHRIIPDELSLSLFGLGILGSFANPFFAGPVYIKALQSVACGLVGGALMWGIAWGGERLFKKEALGGGDIKLIAATGAVLGWRGISGGLFLGSLTGGLIALALLGMKKTKLGETLPFGPFLSFGIYLTCLFPDWISRFLNN